MGCIATPKNYGGGYRVLGKGHEPLPCLAAKLQGAQKILAVSPSPLYGLLLCRHFCPPGGRGKGNRLEALVRHGPVDFVGPREGALRLV